MRKINEELIGKDNVKEQATGTEVSDFVTDEPNAEGAQPLRKQRGRSEQTQSALDEQLFDDEGNPEDADSQDVRKFSERFQGEEEIIEDEDIKFKEDTAEQGEYPDLPAAQSEAAQAGEDRDEKVSMRHGRNLNEDRDGASELQEGSTGLVTKPSESQNLPSNEVEGWMENLEFILDIPLQIDVQLGQTKMPLGKVLEISSGSIIKLNKSESDSVELIINGKLVAEGQIVVTDGNALGVQVTSIVNRVERIRSLR